MKIVKNTSNQISVEKSVIGEVYKIGAYLYMRVHNHDLVGYCFVDLADGVVSSYSPNLKITPVKVELHLK